MLFYPEGVAEKLEKVQALENPLPQSPEDFQQMAQQILEIDPDSGSARLLLATVAEIKGDLKEAERLAWEGLDRLPNHHQSYVTLSRVLVARGDHALARRIFHLAIWKMAMSDEVDPEVRELCELTFDTGDDLDDVGTYFKYAMAGDTQWEKQPDSRAVEQRILPYRLLNELERESDEVSPATVKAILKAREVCAPLLFSSLRQCVREGLDLGESFPLMLIALLGELAGPELIADLLEIPEGDDKALDLQTFWAMWRLGQRHPAEALRVLRAAGLNASTAVRIFIAEQLTELPGEEGITEALVALLDDFESLAKMDDGAELLLAEVVSGLIDRNEDDLARKMLKLHTPRLTKKGAKWIRPYFEGDEDFETILCKENIPALAILEVCVDGILLDEFRDDEFGDDDPLDDPEGFVEDDEIEEDDFEEDDLLTPPPLRAQPKPGRNDPCWCGSGKKYKKCHLDSDEAKPAAPVTTANTAESDRKIASDLAQRIIESAERWHTPGDLKRAKSEYFHSEPPRLDDEEVNGYLQWFAHDFRDSRTNKSLVQHMYEDRKNLPARAQVILEAWVNSYACVCEVMRVEKGLGIELRNVTSDKVDFVNDVTFSREAKQGEWTLARLEYLDGRWQVLSDGYRVPAGMEGRMFKYIEDEARAAGETPDAFVRRMGNRLFRVMHRLGTGPVQ